MRKHLEKENELKLLTHGCTADILNVLEIGNIEEDVVHVVKYF